jgi:DNA polymerase-3 subunit gamma/tau
MIDRLRGIATREGLPVEDGALELIAQQATGSMRDAESLLDQVASFGGPEITLEQVQTMLGTTSSQAVKELVDHLAAQDVAAGLTKIGHVVADGADPRQLNKELLERLRGLLLLKTTSHGPADLTEDQREEMSLQAQHFSLHDLVNTIKVFSQAALDVRGSAQPQLPLELAFVEALLARPSDEVPQSRAAQKPRRESQAPPKKPPAAVAEPAAEPNAETPPPESGANAEVEQDSEPSAIIEGSSDEVLASLQDRWSEIAAAIEQESMHIAAIVRDCRPVSFQDDTLVLEARSPFHREKLESDRARSLVEDAIGKLLGRPCRVRCTLANEKSEQPAPDTDLQGLAEDPLIKAGLDLGGKIGTIK